MTSDRSARIAFVGPLPPPMHGMAAVSAAMVRALQERIGVDVLPVQAGTLGRRLKRHVPKAIGAIRALAALSRAKGRGVRLLYVAVDDGLGGLWTMIFALVGRLVGLRLYLHHHGYRYIASRTRVMGAIVRAAGPGACHVVLCDKMAGDFAALYPAATNFFIAPNSVEPASGSPPRPFSAARPITIGLLSNLTPEKGAAEFIGILERARSRGLDVRGRLAGPATDRATEELVRSKCAALGGALEWMGSVQGAAKEEFFAAIDLFVFPVSKAESFGLVLLEALIRGVPVIAPGRGCICTLAGLEAAEIVPIEESFEERADAFIDRLGADPVLRETLSSLAASQGTFLNEAHRARQLALLDEMIDRVKAAPPL